MRTPRIFTPQSLLPQQVLSLEGPASRHLTQVLRLKPGARVLLFNGDGRDCGGTILRVDKTGVQLAVDYCSPLEPPPRLAISLLQAVGKGERMDFVLQKAAELGAACIRPLFTERTQVRLDGERLNRRMDHWRQVVIAACEQCGRSRLPLLETAARLDAETLGRSPALRLLLEPDAGRYLTELPAPQQGVELLVGPEGGLSSDEIRMAAAQGFVSVRLGPRILRTETAPMAAMAAIQTLWGDFRSAEE